MRFYLTPDGAPAVFYEDSEIEQIASDELHRAGLRPTVSAPITELERFIESHLNVELDQYAELPAGVLGVTRFHQRRVPSIAISGELTDHAASGAPGAQGRWRATLAHEAGHVLLHRYLFDPDLAQSQGAGPPTGELPRTGEVACLHRDILEQPRSRDWREVQANKAMAALLMPATLFRRLALRHGAVDGDLPIARTAAVDDLAATLAELFRVSKQASGIRLKTCGIVVD
jgi:hypothetical protein